jgi:hypothetical protein
MTTGLPLPERRAQQISIEVTRTVVVNTKTRMQVRFGDHPRDGQEDEQSDWMKELKAFLGAGTFLLSVLGALTFGAQRIAYERFYDHFGVTPEDVGIDASRVLSQTAGGLAIWVLAFVAFLGLVFAISTLLLRGRGGKERQEFHRAMRKMLVYGGLAGSILLVVTIFFINSSDANDAAICAARPDGQSVRGIRWGIPSGPDITRLGVRAERAVIRSTDTKSPAPPWNGRQVVYLGAAEGVAVVYDPRGKRTIRIPAASVVVSLNTASERFRWQRGCVLLGQ